MTSPADAPALAPSPIARNDFSSSLHRRFLIGATIGGIATILLLAAAADAVLNQTIARQGDETLREAAHRSSIVLDAALDERTRETDVLAKIGRAHV